MFSFTQNEKIVVVFLIISAFVGSCVVTVKKMNPEMVRDVKLGEAEIQDTTVIFDLEEGKRDEPAEEKKVLMGKININTADMAELQLLPKVGPKTAERILQYRRDFGGFREIADIMKVKGIGEKTFENMEPHITVGNVVVEGNQETPEEPKVEKVEPTPEEEKQKEPEIESDKEVTEKQAEPPKIVNINTATKEELMTLNGIGGAYAERIIQYREENGGFKSVDELLNVKGIGEKRLENIRDRVTIE